MELKSGAAALGVELGEKEIIRFEKYMRLLLEYNKKINLTAITDPDEIVLKHFLDSLTPLTCGELREGASVIDIGAGAGFPSLPLKIARPDLRITMLDSLGKRVDFLNAVIEELDLENVTAVHSRAEDGARGSLRESFDAAVARAVAGLPVLAEYALPFVRIGGCFIAMKGTDAETELASAEPAIRAMGGKTERVVPAGLSGLNHKLCVIRKIAKTPSKYPRKAGKPAKEPIK